MPLILDKSNYDYTPKGERSCNGIEFRIIFNSIIGFLLVFRLPKEEVLTHTWFLFK